jgi:hypothetical protein
MSQTDAILRLLMERGDMGITALDAFADPQIRSLRLAARIADLRADGNNIETQDVTLPNGKRIARYVLHRDYALWTEAELREAYGR